jgi:hypothetical protein
VSISASRAGRKFVKSSGRIVRRANDAAILGFIAHFNVSDTRTEARHDSARMHGLARFEREDRLNDKSSSLGTKCLKVSDEGAEIDGNSAKIMVEK